MTIRTANEAIIPSGKAAANPRPRAEASADEPRRTGRAARLAARTPLVPTAAARPSSVPAALPSRTSRAAWGDGLIDPGFDDLDLDILHLVGLQAPGVGEDWDA